MVLSESDRLLAFDFESKLLQTKIRGGNDYSYHVIWVAEQMTRDQIYLLIISGTLEPFSAYMSSFRITIPNPIANTQKIYVRYQWPTKTSAHFQKTSELGLVGLQNLQDAPLWHQFDADFSFSSLVKFCFIWSDGTTPMTYLKNIIIIFFCLGKEIILVKN